METNRKGQDNWLEECIETAARQTVTSSEPTGDGKKHFLNLDSKESVQKLHRRASKPHSTPLTLKWLEENYEIAEGVCIPRNALYMHYLDFCEKNDSQPVNAASFGKIIRQQFPQITTRRLGTRGQSKYHYYGVGVKESSIYYEVVYSKKGLQNCGEGKRESKMQIVTYSPRSKLGTLLPDFPKVKEVKLPNNIPEEKVNTFLMMYRTHCQRILDTVIRANFEEVQSFFLHFWQGMPPHIIPILGKPVVVHLVGVCDSILYKAISGVLMPTVLQALPDSLTQVIRKFARQLDEWLRQALEELPEPLREMKFELARQFAQILRRQTSLNHLCQASRTVIISHDIVNQMLDDWANVDLTSITKQTLYTMDRYTEKDFKLIVSLYSEFEQLLEDQSPIESYAEWLEGMIDKCVVKPSQKKPGSLRRIARQFLLMWSCFGTRVIRDMTLHSAPSFGSFHLMHLMFDDYVLYLVETLHSGERTNDLLKVIKGQDMLVDPHDDLILPNPAVTFSGSSSPILPTDTAIPNPSLRMDRQSVITDTRDIYGQTNSYPAIDPQAYGNTTDSTGMASQNAPLPQNHNTMYRESYQYNSQYANAQPTHQMGTEEYSLPYSDPSQQSYHYSRIPRERTPSYRNEWNDPRYSQGRDSVVMYESSTDQYNNSYGRGMEYEEQPSQDVSTYNYSDVTMNESRNWQSANSNTAYSQAYDNQNSYFDLQENNNYETMNRKRKILEPLGHPSKRAVTSQYEYSNEVNGPFTRA